MYTVVGHFPVIVGYAVADVDVFVQKMDMGGSLLPIHVH